MTDTKSRPSLAHLSDKFNTAPPPGYVAGRGRGASGFSKPPDDPPRRGKPPPAGEEASASASASAAAAGDGLSGDAGDTRELDLGETEQYELDGTTMEQAEAGGAIEPFNMKSERLEGHFDDDFNYVWKRKGQGEDADAHDAWLGEVDEGAETDEKVQKRRKILEAQMAELAAPADAPTDVSALLAEAASLLRDGETVAGALRRLGDSKTPRPTGSARARKRAADGAPNEPAAESAEARTARRAEFARLTEAADRLLSSGQLEVYTQSKEKLQALAERAAAADAGGSGGRGGGDGVGGAPPAGVSAEAHASAISSGFALDATSGCYYNSESGLCYDARSGLYWHVGQHESGPFYRYDADGGFVLADGAGGADGAGQAEA